MFVRRHLTAKLFVDLMNYEDDFNGLIHTFKVALASKVIWLLHYTYYQSEGHL